MIELIARILAGIEKTTERIFDRMDEINREKDE